MTAFLIDMARLYERFVAGWIKARLGGDYQVSLQERLHFGNDPHHTFVVDMVVYAAESGQALAVLDTKYKASASGPGGADVAQVVAYATAKGSPQAIVVYPGALSRPFDQWIGPVRVRALPFVIEDDLESAGQSFLRSWMPEKS